MTIKIRAEMVGGGPLDFVWQVMQTGALEIQAGVEAATNGLKAELREQISSAGMGDRLGRAIGSRVYPSGGKPSMKAAGIVFPRGPKAEAIIGAYNTGVTITANGGKYLAIPTEKAGRAWRNGRARPGEFQERTGIKLRFVPMKNGNAVLVGQRGSRRGGGRSKPLIFFVLIRSTKVPRRLAFDEAAQRWADRIPDLITAASQGET